MRKPLAPLALALAVTVVWAAQDGVLLRRDLSQDVTDVYTLQVKTTQTITGDQLPGPQDMTIDGSMKLSIKTSKLADGKEKADMNVSVTDMKWDFGGAAAAATGMTDMPNQFQVKALVDARNRVSDVKFEGLSGPMQQMMQSFQQLQALPAIEFPENPVKVGDTWTATIPKSPMTGNKDVTLNVKLVGETTVGDAPAWDLRVEGDVPMDYKPTMGEAAQFEMHLKGTSKINTSAKVAKSSGRLLWLESKSVTDGTMEILDFGMTLNLKSSSTSTMKLAQ